MGRPRPGHRSVARGPHAPIAHQTQTHRCWRLTGRDAARLRLSVARGRTRADDDLTTSPALSRVPQMWVTAGLFRRRCEPRTPTIVDPDDGPESDTHSFLGHPGSAGPASRAPR